MNHHRLQRHRRPVTSVAFLPDNRLVSVSSNEISIWNVAKRLCAHSRWMQQRVDCIATLPKNTASGGGKRLVVSASWNCDGVSMWDPKDTGSTFAVRNCGGEIATSCDGRLLATTMLEDTTFLQNMVRIWDLATGACAHTFFKQSAEALCVTFSPDGKTLAVGLASNIISLWMFATNTCISLEKHHDEVRCVAFNNSGHLLASGSSDCKVCVWNLENETHRCLVLRGHERTIDGVVFLPGPFLASASQDGFARIWNVTQGTCLNVLERGCVSCLYCVAISRAKRKQLWLASGSADGNLYVWPLLNIEIICNASLLLRLNVAPYVILDVANYLLATKNKHNFNDQAEFLHFEKIEFIITLQKLYKK